MYFQASVLFTCTSFVITAILQKYILVFLEKNTKLFFFYIEHVLEDAILILEMAYSFAAI